jgi:hypothetical protein
LTGVFFSVPVVRENEWEGAIFWLRGGGKIHTEGGTGGVRELQENWQWKLPEKEDRSKVKGKDDFWMITDESIAELNSNSFN